MAMRVPSSGALLLLAVLASSGWSSRSAADNTDPRELARVLFQRGVNATAHADYAQALSAFEQAQALRPHPATLYNIALSLWALGRPAAALQTLDQVLAASELSAEKRKQAELQQADWLERVGRIRLTLEPREASVRVGGQAVDSSELVVLAPGWQQVEVRSAGFRGSDRHVYVRPGMLLSLHVALERPGEAASDMAELEVVTFPYGKVWLNGAFAGDSPLQLTLPAGSYRVGGGRENVEGQATLELRPRESRQVVVHWDRPVRAAHNQSP